MSGAAEEFAEDLEMSDLEEELEIQEGYRAARRLFLSDSEEDDDEYDGVPGLRVTDTTPEQLRNGKDIQGIPWDHMSITRESYRKTRLDQYKNYENINDSGEASKKGCTPTEKGGMFYDFRRNTRSVESTILHFQEKVDQARENRGMVKMMHTAGTKSYAKRRAEYKAKHGKEMDQIKLFIDCHSKSADIIAELNNKKNAIPEEERLRESLDQMYEVVVGPGSGDRVNGYGMGVTKSLLRGTTCSSSSTRVIELEKIIGCLKASLEAQAVSHARALEEQATSHARAIE